MSTPSDFELAAKEKEEKNLQLQENISKYMTPDMLRQALETVTDNEKEIQSLIDQSFKKHD